jgi:hypothetical protein
MMFNFLIISTVIDKEYLNRIKKDHEIKLVKKFFIFYLLFFFVSCLLVMFTKYKPFLFLIFFPYMRVFSPHFDTFEKESIFLIKNKYVQLSLVFSIIFFSLVVLF